MTFFSTKKFVAIIAALIMGISHVYADADADNCEQPTKNFQSPCSDVTFCNDDCCNNNWWVFGDLLCWRACEDGFSCDFGTTNIVNTVTNGQLVTSINEHDKEIHFDWNLGFRVGAGYHLPCDCWDAVVYWTHFHEKGQGHACENRAHWKLMFNTVDALLGYNYCCGSCFTIKPFLGVRYAKINQRLRTRLETTITAATGSSMVISTERNREHFWGAGPQLGFEADWNLGCGFSVYGGLAGNLLYGHFDVKFDDVNAFVLALNECHAKKDTRACQTGLDGSIGVRWDYNCVTLQLGLEHHRYFDFNKMGCGGNLNLYGGNASIIVRF